MKSSWFWIIAIFLSIYLVFFNLEKVNFITADLGRHIKNGEIFIHSGSYGLSKSAILHTNFFSYTHPDFPFINHHWGSGIVAYLIFLVAGFNGLSLVYIGLLVSALVCTLLTMKNDATPSSLFLGGLFLVPLIADRMDVRPEGVSYLFISLFLYFLYQFSKGRLSYKVLYVIPFLELLWVNFHIYFIFGPFLVGVFLLEALAHKIVFKTHPTWEQVKQLSIILGLTSLATLVSPYGLSGALYPFVIFHNYGYRIVENQSIPFLEHLSFTNPSFLWYKITTVFIAVSSIFILLKRHKDFAWSLSIIALTFAVIAFLGIRSLTAFALVSLPLCIYNLSILSEYVSRAFSRLETEVRMAIYCVCVFLLLITTCFHFSSRLPWNRNFGIGLVEHSFDSTHFIQATGLHGPVFNNYDIGGAMIYSLYPEEKVFVDNRPEAYPAAFFHDVYIPMQENDTVWQTTLAQYQFNMIYFYRLDMTPWAQAFLIARVHDSQWAPVYVDDQTIIFLRRSDENKKIIETYELPKSLFGIK